MDAISRKKPSFFIPAAIVIMPFIILYCSEAVLRQDMLRPFAWMAAHFGAAAFTWLLINLAAMVLYALFRRLFTAYLPPALIVLLLTLISYYKNAINGFPLQLSDFSLAGELTHIAGYAMPQIRVSAVTAAAVIVLIAALAAVFLIDRKHRPERRYIAMLGAAGAVLLAAAAIPGAFQHRAADMAAGCADQRERNERLGLIAGLYSACALRSEDRISFEYYDSEEISAILADLYLPPAEQPRDGEELPNIIFIVSESFFDVSRLPNVEFSADPLPVFHSLLDSCVHGRFISNTYGGGTGYVEMEILSGVNGSLLKEGDTLSSLSAESYDSMPSIVKLLKNAGYTASAVHSHTDKLYNRRMIYPRIGFDTVLFSDDFPENAERRGPYISDPAFADLIISLYESAQDAPQFIYGMSMENHQPYNSDKFGFSSGIEISSELLDEEDKTVLDALLVGLADADRSLEMLIDHFSGKSEKVMLVFVGDHLPTLTLPDGDSLYYRLGCCHSSDSSLWEGQELVDMLSTDYLIWTNYPSGDAAPKTESCTFLGLETMKMAGVELNSYFDWLDNYVRRGMLMYRSRLFVDGAGVPSHDVPDEAVPMLEKYRLAARSVLYGETAQPGG